MQNSIKSNQKKYVYNILNWRQGTHIIERSENVLLKYISTKWNFYRSFHLIQIESTRIGCDNRYSFPLLTFPFIINMS